MPAVVDLLRFVLGLVDDPVGRDRVRADPAGVLDRDVEGASDLTGEDVEAAVAWAGRRVASDRVRRLRLTETVRPVGEETPFDAAVRVLCALCDQLDGPAVQPVTLPHRELQPDPPPPATVAQGGGEPVPREPPGGRWLHPVISDDDARP